MGSFAPEETVRDAKQHMLDVLDGRGASREEMSQCINFLHWLNGSNTCPVIGQQISAENVLMVCDKFEDELWHTMQAGSRSGRHVDFDPRLSERFMSCRNNAHKLIYTRAPIAVP